MYLENGLTVEILDNGARILTQVYLCGTTTLVHMLEWLIFVMSRYFTLHCVPLAWSYFVMDSALTTLVW